MRTPCDATRIQFVDDRQAEGVADDETAGFIEDCSMDGKAGLRQNVGRSIHPTDCLRCGYAQRKSGDVRRHAKTANAITKIIAGIWLGWTVGGKFNPTATFPN